MEFLIGFGILGAALLWVGAIVLGIHLAVDRGKWYGWIIFGIPILAWLTMMGFLLGDSILDAIA